MGVRVINVTSRSITRKVMAEFLDDLINTTAGLGAEYSDPLHRDAYRYNYMERRLVSMVEELRGSM